MRRYFFSTSACRICWFLDSSTTFIHCFALMKNEVRCICFMKDLETFKHKHWEAFDITYAHFLVAGDLLLLQTSSEWCQTLQCTGFISASLRVSRAPNPSDVSQNHSTVVAVRIFAQHQFPGGVALSTTWREVTRIVSYLFSVGRVSTMCFPIHGLPLCASGRVASFVASWKRISQTPKYTTGEHHLPMSRRSSV